MANIVPDTRLRARAKHKFCELWASSIKCTCTCKADTPRLLLCSASALNALYARHTRQPLLFRIATLAQCHAVYIHETVNSTRSPVPRFPIHWVVVILHNGLQAHSAAVCCSPPLFSLAQKSHITPNGTHYVLFSCLFLAALRICAEEEER